MDYEKVFNVIAFIIALILMFIITVCFFRGCSDRRRSKGTDDGDKRIQEGFDESKRTSGELAESVESAGSHLDRAESILQGAIDRSREKEESLSDSNNSN